MSSYDTCTLCPRMCRARRSEGERGLCQSSSDLRVARAALHFWEEPPISGEAGSGAIFFSGCPLRCRFCQNHEISHEGVGKQIGTDRLARIMLELQDQGALNINLVTPLHFAPHIVGALRKARKQGLRLPIVCNTSGYERSSVVRELANDIDIWLTDFKYASSDIAARLSGARDYPAIAADALREMLTSLRSHGGKRLDEQGIMQRGVIVRHLVLPSFVQDSLDVLDKVWSLGGNEVDLSVMNQYTPNERCRAEGGPLAHALDPDEYEIVLCHADDLGFEHVWWQEGGTVSESFVPSFDETGV